MLDFGGTWEKYLPLVEFAYNNSFQASIGMAPYEAFTSHLSGVFSTPNPRVFDEKVCIHVFATLTHSVRPVTMADIPCVLGSDTKCMTQVIYEWKSHRSDW